MTSIGMSKEGRNVQNMTSHGRLWDVTVVWDVSRSDLHALKTIATVRIQGKNMKVHINPVFNHD